MGQLNGLLIGYTGLGVRGVVGTLSRMAVTVGKLLILPRLSSLISNLDVKIARTQVRAT